MGKRCFPDDRYPEPLAPILEPCAKHGQESEMKYKNSKNKLEIFVEKNELKKNDDTTIDIKQG